MCLQIYVLYVGPPVIDFITNNTVAFEGSKVNLNCIATNDVDAVTPLTIEWYNSEGLKLKTEGKHKLHITQPIQILVRCYCLIQLTTLIVENTHVMPSMIMIATLRIKLTSLLNVRL